MLMLVLLLLLLIDPLLLVLLLVLKGSIRRNYELIRIDDPDHSTAAGTFQTHQVGQNRYIFGFF